MRPDRYINASEVNSFVFCKRAWSLQQRGAPSSLGVERTAGTAFHQQHGKQVHGSARNRRLAIWLVLMACLLLLAAVLLQR